MVVGKFKQKPALLLVLLLVFSACEEPDVIVHEADSIPLKAGMEVRVQQDNAFAFDLFREVLNHNDEEQNIFISPLSVSIALGMAWNGAHGVTKTEMETALHMSGMTPEEINEYYQIMLSALPKADPLSALNIANSLWYREGFPIKNSYLQVNRAYFDAEVRGLDFNKPEALDIINSWCAEKTNDLIQEPLDAISPDAVMYLINAIYFKGMWVNKFDPEDTFAADFHAEDDQTVQVNMMQQLDTFRYRADDVAQYLDMPYGNKAFSMTVILPREGKSTDEVLGSLDLDAWNQVVEGMTTQKVQVFLPKFKTEGRYELKVPLMQLGMINAFSNAADFSGISDVDILISRIIHSTYCDVNEEGTEAAAVTIIEFEYTSLPDYPTFHANRPFLFVIRENSTGVILFMGKMGQVEMYE